MGGPSDLVTSQNRTARFETEEYI